MVSIGKTRGTIHGHHTKYVEFNDFLLLASCEFVDCISFSAACECAVSKVC